MGGTFWSLVCTLMKCFYGTRGVKKAGLIRQCEDLEGFYMTIMYIYEMVEVD